MPEELGIMDGDDYFGFRFQSLLFCLLHIRDPVHILYEEPRFAYSIPVGFLGIGILRCLRGILQIRRYGTIIIYGASGVGIPEIGVVEIRDAFEDIAGHATHDSCSQSVRKRPVCGPEGAAGIDGIAVNSVDVHFAARRFFQEIVTKFQVLAACADKRCHR